jgi:hypothetical protein
MASSSLSLSLSSFRTTPCSPLDDADGEEEEDLSLESWTSVLRRMGAMASFLDNGVLLGE